MMISQRRIRDIELADFKVQSYTRTLARARADGDTGRIAEYSELLQQTQADVRGLRLALLRTLWRQRAKRSRKERSNA